MSGVAIPRALRPAPRPLGLYFRVNFNGHTTLAELLTAGQRSYHGLVFDATRVKRHRELLKEAESHQLEVILDPCTHASATVGGYTEKHAKLPWGKSEPHTEKDFRGQSLKAIVQHIATFAVHHGFTQVMAPTHYLASSESKWLELDLEATRAFREALDRNGGKDIKIIFPLSISYAVMRNGDDRGRIIDGFTQHLPVEAVWLRVDGCGATSNPTQVRNYIQAARQFAAAGLPLIADQIGGVPGLSVLAFGAAGGIATGIALGERFDASNWHRERTSDTAYSRRPGVYIPSIGLMLDSKEAGRLFDQHLRLKGKLGCTDADCCPRGVIDMLENPGRHFLVQRIKEVSELGKHPESVRPDIFLERYVRPMTDQILALSKVAAMPPELQSRLSSHRRRMDNTRVMLGKVREEMRLERPMTSIRIPDTRTVRDGPAPQRGATTLYQV